MSCLLSDGAASDGDESQRPTFRTPESTDGGARRISWPTDLHSLGIDATDAVQPPPRSGVRIALPSIDASRRPAPHLDNNTNNLETISNSNSSSIQSNGTDITIANIVTNVIGIVESDAAALASAGQPSANNDTEIGPNHAVPFIYIDDNGIFQIKFNQSEHISPPIIEDGPVKPAGGGMTSINDRNPNNNNQDEQQYDLDIRFGGASDQNAIIDRNSDKEADEKMAFIIAVDENANSTAH